MVDSVSPSGSEAPLPANYKGEFKTSPEFQKFWAKLFHQPIEPKQAAKMTEQLVNQVWSDCNRVLQHALQAQKDLEKDREEAENS